MQGLSSGPAKTMAEKRPPGFNAAWMAARHFAGNLKYLLAVTRHGAFAAMPTHAEVRRLLQDEDTHGPA